MREESLHHLFGKPQDNTAPPGPRLSGESLEFLNLNGSAFTWGLNPYEKGRFCLAAEFQLVS